jgi:uncharacterized spore protein YtfJ
MENKVEELLDKISGHLKEMTKTETIIGEEFTMGEYLCKPVIRVGMGFGSAGGTGESPKAQGNGTGGGAGAGLGISPVGFLITRKDEITFISTEKNKGFGAIAEKVPDIVEKLIDMKNAQEAKEKAKKDKKE